MKSVSPLSNSNTQFTLTIKKCNEAAEQTADASLDIEVTASTSSTQFENIHEQLNSSIADYLVKKRTDSARKLSEIFSNGASAVTSSAKGAVNAFTANAAAGYNVAASSLSELSGKTANAVSSFGSLVTSNKTITAQDITNITASLEKLTNEKAVVLEIRSGGTRKRRVASNHRRRSARKSTIKKATSARKTSNRRKSRRSSR